MNILFVGAGKMATALAGGLARNKVFPTEAIAACDISPAARESFQAATGLPCQETPASLIGAAEVIVLAVKPQTAEIAVRALPPRQKAVIVISICAGINTAKLRSWFGGGRIVRVMPNTPLLVGKGASCYALGPDADKEAAKITEQIFSSLGQVWQVPEDWLDAVTAISGSGPAYMFEFIEALRLAGVKLGLPTELALALAVQTMSGAAEMLRQNLGSPEDLRRAVTSPGGTTAAALAVLEKAAFRQTIEEMARAAQARSLELGR